MAERFLLPAAACCLNSSIINIQALQRERICLYLRICAIDRRIKYRRSKPLKFDCYRFLIVHRHNHIRADNTRMDCLGIRNNRFSILASSNNNRSTKLNSIRPFASHILNPPRLPQELSRAVITTGREVRDVVVVFAGQIIGSQTANSKFLMAVLTLCTDAVCTVLALGNLDIIAFIGMMPMVIGKLTDFTR